MLGRLDSRMKRTHQSRKDCLALPISDVRSAGEIFILHRSRASVGRVNQRQLINLIARLAHETHNAKTRISSISKTTLSPRTRL
jgi:hypothetical protein